MPAIDDLRDLLERQLRTIERTSDGVRDGSDPEDLHRFRVATRRARALIRASRPLVRDQLAGVDRELRWLGGVSGPVRDLDVMIDHLRSALPELDPDQAGAEAIVAALERDRLRQREALLAALASPRFPALLARFTETLPTLRVRDRGVSLVGLARRELERFRADYRNLGDRPSDDELHAVRIRAKHARYAAELAALSEGDALATLADALRVVQDLIGAHQDAVVAEQRVRALATDESRLAAGRIVEHERSAKLAARTDLPAAVGRVERTAHKAFDA
jgi:CHAD domain-containing protein